MRRAVSSPPSPSAAAWATATRSRCAGEGGSEGHNRRATLERQQRVTGMRPDCPKSVCVSGPHVPGDPARSVSGVSCSNTRRAASYSEIEKVRPDGDSRSSHGSVSDQAHVRSEFRRAEPHIDRAVYSAFVLVERLNWSLGVISWERVLDTLRVWERNGTNQTMAPLGCDVRQATREEDEFECMHPVDNAVLGAQFAVSDPQ